MIGKRKIVFGIVLCVVFLASIGGVSSVIAIDLPPLNEIEKTSITAFSGQKESFNPKMDSGINRIVSDYKKSQSGTIKAMSSNSQVPEKKKCISVKMPEIVNNRVKAYLDLENKKNIEELQEKYDITGIITTDFSETAQANVRVDDLEKLASEDSVKFIRVPVMAVRNEADIGNITSAVISEGVKVIQADKLHEMGITGKEVKTAIIDAGFYPYEKDPEIYNIDEIKAFRNDSDIYGGKEAHGTASAELLCDVSRGPLSLYSVETNLEYTEVMEHIIKRGDISVISCSFGFLDGFPEESISNKATEKARDNGIISVVSSGNYQKQHYQDIPTDIDGDGWLEFGPGDETQKITVSGNASISLFSRWENKKQNNDLYLLEQTINGFNTIACSNNSGMGFQSIEGTLHVSTGIACLYIAVYKRSNDNNSTEIELFSLENDLQYITPGNSITSPATAKGAIAVGAIDIDTREIQDYSSYGKQMKFVGISPVQTWIFLNPFGGTSAATPPIAGAFALLMSAYPEATDEEIIEALEQTALDFGPEGWDEKSGYGIPQVKDAFDYLCPPETPENSTINATVNFSEAVTIANQS